MAILVLVGLLLAMPVLCFWFLHAGNRRDDWGGRGGFDDPPPPEPPPPDDPPAWWPDFEREFAAHVAALGSACRTDEAAVRTP